MTFLSPMIELIDLGGPVVLLLALMSVGALAVVLWKLWQFHALGVGRHAEGRFSHLNPVLKSVRAAGPGPEETARIEAEAEAALATLESGFRLLDSVAQTAPLLGLFGTVLGMIDAFQALQGAGASVDPAILAGGIWVALLTTAVGLGVAMPTQLALTWFDARVAQERLWASGALARIRAMPAGAGDAG
jgi:biopolymer transport protein ExbB